MPGPDDKIITFCILLYPISVCSRSKRDKLERPAVRGKPKPRLLGVVDYNLT
jgi:hypothetical protein